MSFSQLLRKITTSSKECDANALYSAEACQNPVRITLSLDELPVIHKGKKVIITREQDPDHKIPSLFNKTSRPCPPFCVQPMTAAPGVETIGELELMQYLREVKNGDTLVVDSRLKSWVKKGTIPGSIHVPWTALVESEGATFKGALDILLDHFSVSIKEGKTFGDVRAAFDHREIQKVLDFTDAKTLALFCNGSWCGQTSESIKALLALGYPSKKIKYYRDGMQGWVTLGLTTVID